MWKVGDHGTYNGLNYPNRAGQEVVLLASTGNDNFQLRFVRDGFIHPSCGLCSLNFLRHAELTVNKLGNFPRKKQEEVEL